MTHLAVPLISTAEPLAEQVAAAVAAGAGLIELRVDQLGDVEAVATLLRAARRVPFILTIRPVEEGGAWDGDEAERVALLERLGLLLPGYVDVELAAWQRSANLRQKIRLVADPDATPDATPDASPDASLDASLDATLDATLDAAYGPTAAHGPPRPDEVSADAPIAGLGSAVRAGAAGTARPRNRLILSRHDLRQTPADLAAAFAELAAAPAAVHKAVFLAADATDALRICAILGRQRDPSCWIALALGAAGLASRVLARKLGGFLTFAALQPGQESAAGQPTVAELRGLYRWDELGPRTAVYGVVGWPVGHSRSPLVQNAALRAARIDAVYLPLPVRPGYEDFVAFMNQVRAHPELDIRGLSVTIPHKEHALRWLLEQGGELSPAARRCGAVNTLALRETGWSGDNTDGAGALAALGGQSPGTAHILGAGGAARAIAAELCAAGWRVCLFNRDSLRAATLARELGCAWRVWEERGRRRCDLLVNSTPLGMAPDWIDQTPVPTAALRAVRVVFDMVYTPSDTRLLREARAAGAMVISGVEMFLAQAALQFERWHGAPPPAGSMLAAWRSAP